MTIQEMHYQFRLLADRLDTNIYVQLPPNQIDELLNLAIKKIVNNKYTGKNPLQQPFESTQGNLDDLSTLIIDSPGMQPPIPFVNQEDTVYEFDLTGLNYNYERYVRSKVITDCGRRINLTIVQHDDLQEKLVNEMTKPSLIWSRALGTFSRSNTDYPAIYVHTAGVYEPSLLEITYIKNPAKVQLGGYLNITGGVTTDVNCDLPEHVHPLVVKEAVKLTQGILENPGGFQIASQNVIEN